MSAPPHAPAVKLPIIGFMSRSHQHVHATIIFTILEPQIVQAALIVVSLATE